MDLDTVTLMVVGSLAAGLGGFWLLWARVHTGATVALSWWAAAYLFYAAGIAGIGIGLADNRLSALLVGTLLSNLTPALIWGGTRKFTGRSTPVLVLLAGTIAWMAVSAATFSAGPDNAGAAVSFAIWVVLLLASTWELWRTRGEELPARRPLMALFVIHAAVYAGGIYDVLAGNFPSAGLPPLNSWFGIIHIEGMIYSLGSAMLLAKLCAERGERTLRDAARVDSLTGTASRGAFFDGAERAFRRCRHDGTPLSVIMFDLDRFKSINDTYGHRIGDKVLRLFADTVRGALRPNDLFGRYGGEEFVVVLPNANGEVAFVIAERVRHAFADASRTFDGVEHTASVSAGVATSRPDASLETILSAADAAMYQAKRLGRNRVERSNETGDRDGTNIIRVA